MTSYADRLDQCYKKAYDDGDINLAVEVAIRIGLILPDQEPDERIQKFVEKLDEMVSDAERSETGENVLPHLLEHRFEYGGQNFEVKII